MNRAENAGRILKSYRSNRGGRKTAERRKSFYIGDDARAAGRVESGNGQANGNLGFGIWDLGFIFSLVVHF